MLIQSLFRKDNIKVRWKILFVDISNIIWLIIEKYIFFNKKESFWNYRILTITLFRIVQKIFNIKLQKIYIFLNHLGEISFKYTLILTGLHVINMKWTLRLKNYSIKKICFQMIFKVSELRKLFCMIVKFGMIRSEKRNVLNLFLLKFCQSQLFYNLSKTKLGRSIFFPGRRHKIINNYWYLKLRFPLINFQNF